jgi:hypothetical protein
MEKKEKTYSGQCVPEQERNSECSIEDHSEEKDGVLPARNIRG